MATVAAGRMPFLDWTRGIAVLVMIQCHTFNSLTRMDLREGGPYVLTQFVGGMAAPLFLFLAGVTFAFGMERQERHGASWKAKLAVSLKRAGYILFLAFLFRFSNWIFSSPRGPWQSMLRVDILNCMGFGLAVLAPAALLPGAVRARVMALVGLAIAAASPVVNGLDWSGAPEVVRNYLVPSHLGFAFFPCAAYLAFGLSVGTILRRLSADRVERTMQWAVVVGLATVAAGQYFSNIPYSVYTKSSFWIDSPALIVIRVGLILLLLAAAYLWTEFAAGDGWSWVQTLGKTSLMVYWVHVVLVYGSVVNRWKRALSVEEATAATIAVTLLMLGLAVARLRWLVLPRFAKAGQEAGRRPGGLPHLG